MLKHVYYFELTKIYDIFIIKIVFINCLIIEFYRGFYLQKTQNITKGSTDSEVWPYDVGHKKNK